MKIQILKREKLWWWLPLQQGGEKGATLLEVVVAILVIGLALMLNGMFLVAMKIQNKKEGELKTAAVSLAANVIEQTRQITADNVTGLSPTGLSPTLVNATRAGGYSLQVYRYVCTENPTLQEQTTTAGRTIRVTSCSTAANDQERHVVVEVRRERENEAIYTVQTTFTNIRISQGSNP
ncbi:MAG: hypothetical protein NZ901_09550 [Geminocystis sp.]|nr:hypothetical protein [Geminocystis sp.]HIK37191.1 hypothetical protein [Geminocystis sp. M7585_C2015_104]MCS7148418.1 hypothetical protein [Geminocystis sp.]MCX8078267.1 hypothetical protein [Geminocystis sp.]MDW8115994.1 hypothetical protein [Geminocystis sp.]